LIGKLREIQKAYVKSNLADKETNVCFSASQKHLRLMGIMKHLVLGGNTVQKRKAKKHFKLSKWQGTADFERERIVDKMQMRYGETNRVIQLQGTL